MSKAKKSTVASVAKPRIRGLAVGINRFPHLPAQNQLHGCVRDAENISRLLMEQFGAHPADIRQLHDERATKQAVMERLKWLVAHTGKDEVAVFHISTHGSLFTRRNAAGNTLDHASEVLCLSDITLQFDNPDSYISDSELAAVLRDLHPQALFIAVMDACHSGAAADIARDLDASNPHRYLEPPADIKHRDAARLARHGNVDSRHRLFARSASMMDAHVLVLAACGAQQTSNDTQFGKEARAEGAFTHFLCEVLRKESGLSYQTLLNKVQAGLDKNGDKQTPEFMPHIYSGEPVFQPLRAEVQMRRVQRKQGLSGKYHFWNSKNERVQSADLVRGLSPQELTDDPKLQNIIAELKRSGLEVGEGFNSLEQFAPDKAARCEATLTGGHGALLMEYHEGLVIWHKATSVEEVRTVAGADQEDAGTRNITFHIPPLPPKTMERHTAKGLLDDFSDIADRVFHVVTHPIEAVTKAIVQGIEGAVITEGLHQYSGKDFSTGRHIDGQITAPNQQAVLFIHGVLSSVEGCFNKPEVCALLPDLQKDYLVLGYDHFSASKSIEDIAHDLDLALSNCLADGVKLNIICHSQGGVIARELAKYRSVLRIISFGSPHRGTSLAGSLEKFVTVMAALQIPYLSTLFKLLKYVDNMDVIPGFLEMDAGGKYITDLNSNTSGRTAFYCCTSNFKPAPSDGVLARLAEQMETLAFFQGNDNDLVIDTANMVPPNGFHVVDQKEYGQDDHVMHTKYFNQKDLATFIQKSLN